MGSMKIVVPVLLVILAVAAFALTYGRSAKAQEGTAAPAPAAAQAQTGIYPLDTCPVTGEELGSMGEPVVYDYEGREVRFCCKGCISKFEADPQQYLKQIDQAIIAQQLPDYPLSTCPVMGDELDEGDAIDFVYDNRLFRLCCLDCVKQVKADPAKYGAKLDQAVIEAQLADYPLDTCVVTGEKLGSMGDPIDYVYAGRLVHFCCKGCIRQFEANPQKYLSQLD